MSKQSNLEEDAGDDVLLAAAKIQAMWKGRQVRKVIAAEVLPIVQFSTSIYYAEEDEEHIFVDIVRLGPCETESRVRYATESSGNAAVKFEAVSGTAFFAADETIFTVPVKLINDDVYDPSIEFVMTLSDPEGCETGLYLYRCRVKIIENDVFPTNKYKAEILSDPHKVPGLLLMLEYVKYNLGHPTVRVASMKMFFCDLAENAFYIWSLFLMRYMVEQAEIALATADFDRQLEDSQSAGGGDGDSDCSKPRRFLAAAVRRLSDDQESVSVFVLIAFGLAVPFLVLHYLDFQKNYWKLGGTVRRLVQENLLIRFLSYDEVSRSNLSAADLIMCMSRDVVELQAGFMYFFDITKGISKLIFIVAVQFAFNISDGADWFLLGASIIPLVVKFFLFAVFIRARESKTVKLRMKLEDTMFDVAASVRDTITNYRLVADYFQRPAAVERFRQRIHKYNGADTHSKACNANNEYFPQWMALITQCFWIVLGGFMMLEGFLGLPSFLVTLTIFRTTGAEFQKIYLSYVKIQDEFAPLYRVVHYMNLPTDLHKRKTVNRRRRERGKEERLKMREYVRKATESGALQANQALFPVDFVAIQCVDLSFSFKGHGEEEMEQVLTNVSIELPQGEMICVCGPQGHGKNTFLQCIGQVLFPDEGEVFVPPHLRVLYIPSEVYFIEEEIRDNLFFGRGLEELSNAEWRRGLRICKKLGFQDRMLAYITSKEPTIELMLNQAAMLSRSERALLNLARAFIYNPEVQQR
jgi:ABC-type multidrug transport system fused ATPase/permease subunit